MTGDSSKLSARYRWLRFGLKALLTFFVLLSVGMAWWTGRISVQSPATWEAGAVGVGNSDLTQAFDVRFERERFGEVHVLKLVSDKVAKPAGIDLPSSTAFFDPSSLDEKFSDTDSIMDRKEVDMARINATVGCRIILHAVNPNLPVYSSDRSARSYSGRIVVFAATLGCNSEDCFDRYGRVIRSSQRPSAPWGFVVRGELFMFFLYPTEGRRASRPLEPQLRFKGNRITLATLYTVDGEFLYRNRFELVATNEASK